MPIEQTLESIDASLKAILVVLQTGKADAPAGNPRDVAFGDPEGTTYYHLAKNKTLAAVKPGEAPPNVKGMVQIGGPEYATLKGKYDAETKKITSQPAAGPTSSGKPAESPAKVGDDFQKVVDALMALAKTEGKGRDAVTRIVKHFGVDTVPKLQPLGKNAEILKAVEAELAPPADENSDALFG